MCTYRVPGAERRPKRVSASVWMQDKEKNHTVIITKKVKSKDILSKAEGWSNEGLASKK